MVFMIPFDQHVDRGTQVNKTKLDFKVQHFI